MADLVTTIPVIFPMMRALDYDPVSFGVIMAMLAGIALIGPPDGTVPCVLRKDGGPIGDRVAGMLPFVAAGIAATLLPMIWPEIALWLPQVTRS